MKRTLVSATLVVASAIVIGCGSSTPPVDGAPVTVASVAKPAGDAPPATSAPEPSAKPAALIPPFPNGAEAPPFEPLFKGEEPAGGTKLTTTRGWTYATHFQGIGPYKVKESNDKTTTFFDFGSDRQTFVVATAFSRPAVTPKLKKGDFVWAPIVASGVCGVVREVKGDKVTVAVVWVDKLDTRELVAENLLRMNEKLEFGAPVLFKKDEAWKSGVLVNADKTNAWIAPVDLAQDEAKVPVSTVFAMDVAKKRKKGDKVVACSFNTFGCTETTIVGPQQDGLSYDVAPPDDYAGPAGEGKKSTPASACMIGSVPKK